VLVQADQLPTGELELVYAVASVAQSSYEYWPANTAMEEQVANSYGDCLAPYTDATTAVTSCIGVTHQTPTRYRGLSPVPIISFASISFASMPACSGPDFPSMGHADVVGATFGGLAGLFSPGGAAGAAGGAASAAVGASVTEGLWQWGSYVWCRIRGGHRYPGSLY
jgi:hypothetical protein